MQNNFEAILHNNIPSNDQLVNHMNELEQNIDILKPIIIKYSWTRKKKKQKKQ